jgi:hypothetical protein
MRVSGSILVFFLAQNEEACVQVWFCPGTYAHKPLDEACMLMVVMLHKQCLVTASCMHFIAQSLLVYYSKLRTHAEQGTLPRKVSS